MNLTANKLEIVGNCWPLFATSLKKLGLGTDSNVSGLLMTK